jgi:filamentous hemagglutinin family protein
LGDEGKLDHTCQISLHPSAQNIIKTICGTIAFSSLFFYSSFATAQIIPDETLGQENSRVTRDVEVRGGRGDRIDGGAARGVNLFHSFREFNVNEGQRVYFANPSSVENILSRVTGADVSEILGTLGVDGGANLFLLNPNGMIFGPNARLDISGSFTASGGDRFTFPDGSEFSAINPQAAPLLTVNVPIGVQWGGGQGAIANQGNLTVGRDLTLAANTLDLQGHLWTGGNLTLDANVLRIRDSAVTPFIAVAAGQLLLQGNQTVDIFALNHPQSGFFSGGDMVLRSTHAIGGDAHFNTNGDFRIEQMNGALGELFSPRDPIIRANGDVFLQGYTGASLHILAGGSVRIPGLIWINAPDLTGNAIAETITLSNGETIVINGAIEPTLDIRAGINWITPPGNTVDGVIPTAPFFIPGVPTRADIIVGRIEVYNFNDGDTVFLTNQYLPNLALLGDIVLGLPTAINSFAIDARDDFGGGDVTLDSRGGIIINSQVDASSFFARQGNGGDVTFIANGDIILNPRSVIRSVGISGGDIRLLSRNSQIALNGDIDASASSASPFDLLNFTGNGGSIAIQAQNDITFNPGVYVASFGLRGGEISVSSHVGNLTLNNSVIGNLGTGNQSSGLLSFDANSIFLQERAFVGTLSFGGTGQGGDIFVNATDRVEILNRVPDLVNTGNIFLDEIRDRFDGVGFVTTTAIGNGGAGDLTIDTNHLLIQNERDNPTLPDGGSYAGATTFTFSDSFGDSGNLTVYANSIEILGSRTVAFVPTPNQDTALAIASIKTGLTTATQGLSPAGDLTVNTGTLILRNGAAITTGNVSAFIFGSDNPQETGDGGRLTINASEFIELEGLAALASSSLGEGQAGELLLNVAHDQGGRITLRDGAVISTDTLGTGSANNLIIATSLLEILGGSRIGAATGSSGSGASISINADSVNVAGTSIDPDVASGIFASVYSGASGDAGDISIAAQQINITEGGQIAASTLSTGAQGNINIQQTDGIFLDNGSISTAVNSGANVDSSSTDARGNIDIQTRSLTLTNSSEITANTSGQGDAGRISVRDADTISLAENSIISTAVNAGAIGVGGDVDLRGNAITLTDNSSISANTAGQGTAGNVTIIGNRFEASQGGQVLTSTSSSDDAGNIQLTIGDRLILIGSNTGLFARTELDAAGAGGDIAIQTGGLEVSDRAAIAVNSQGIGDAGNLNITANTALLNNDARFTAETLDSEGGNIILSILDTLRLQSDSEISASTRSGQGGNLIVNLSQSPINLIEVLSNSRLITEAESGSAGNLSLNARQVSLQDQSVVSASTQSGRGGDLLIQGLENLQVNGSEISASTATGSAGDVVIEAIAGNIFLTDQAVLSVAATEGGTAGDLALAAAQIALNEGAQITVNSTGIGVAGNLSIIADDLLLDNQARLTATTQANPDGGNIDLQIANSIRLRNQSEISASTQDGQGGILIVNSEGNPVNTLELSNSQMTTSATGIGNAGRLQVRASAVDLSDRSIIAAATQSGISGNVSLSELNTLRLDNSNITASTQTGQAGGLEINAMNLVRLQGAGGLSVAAEQPGGIAGNIIVNTRNLIVRDGSEISASNFSANSGGNIRLLELETLRVNNGSIAAATETGQAGNLLVESNETIQINNGGELTTAANAGGAAGNLTLRTALLDLTNAQVSVSSTGSGRSGDLTITADQIAMSDRARFTAETEAGRGGNIELRIAENLNLTDRSRITASTQAGRGGRLRINADQAAVNAIVLSGNSEIATAATGRGNAGTLELHVQQLSLFDRSNITASARSGQGGDINLRGLDTVFIDNSNISAEADQQNGSAGNLSITTGQITVQNGSGVTVSNPTGQAGELAIQADILSLLNQGELTAETGGLPDTSDQSGANIRMNGLNRLQMRNNSLISAEARDRANGGNITIDAENGFVIGPSTENNDIVADAQQGDGGEINITTQAILGLEFRPARTPLSDITASSEFGVDGQVIINTPGIDPSQGLVELPTSPVDASNQIAQACSTNTADNELNSFTVTGRGGLPANPNQFLETDNTFTPWVTSSDSASSSLPPAPPSIPTLTEAQGWVLGADGTITLVAHLPSTLPAPVAATRHCGHPTSRQNLQP